MDSGCDVITPLKPQQYFIVGRLLYSLSFFVVISPESVSLAHLGLVFSHISQSAIKRLLKTKLNREGKKA